VRCDYCRLGGNPFRGPVSISVHRAVKIPIILVGSLADPTVLTASVDADPGIVNEGLQRWELLLGDRTAPTRVTRGYSDHI